MGPDRGRPGALRAGFYEDLTEAQTAAALGVTVGTVKSQTSRALAAMRLDPALAPTEVAP